MFDVEKIRLDFPILAKEIFGNPLVYLDNAATSQKPRQVIDALVDYYENFNANVHRGVHTLSMEATDKYEDAREKVSSFINSESSDSVIWTRNASESLNLVAYSWGENNINEGDEILLTPMEHHSNLVPWQELARRKNADIKFIPMLENGTLDMDRVDDLITEKTALVSAVHMSNALGTINPVRELGVKAHRMGAKILVDGAQSVPHMPTDVQELNCDFLVFSGHKMLGPTGIGALYVKKEILESMEPFLTGGEMVLEVSYEEASWADLPMKFEAGTPNIADSIGLGSAVDYLNVLGMENVREHEKDLTTYALNRFKNADLEGHDLGTFLDRIGIAVRTGHHCAMPLVRSLGVAATARASFYLYNTKKEVDILVDGVTEALRYFRDGPN